MRIQNNHEIKKEMKLWSKRTLAGLLFDKKILNKVFPEDSLKKSISIIKWRGIYLL